MAKQKKAPPPLLSVRAVLNDLQHGFESASHPRELWATCLQEPERFVQELLECLLLVVQAPEECPAEEGVIRFFGRWVSCMPDGTDSDAAEDAIGCVLRALTGYLGHEEAHSRRRCMSMLFQALNCLPKEAALNSEVLAELAVCCATLLEDRDSKMRRMATMCLKHLIFVDEDTPAMAHPHVVALMDLLATEPTEGVRVEAVRAIPLAPDTLPAVLARARDGSAKVAAAVYGIVAQGVEPQYLTLDQKIALLQDGLRERRKDVAAAAGLLLHAWFAGCCQADPLRVLEEVAPQLYPDLATLCLDELSGSGVWDVEAWLKAATARGTSLSHRAVAAAAARQQQQQPAAADMTMTACEAFLCRYACLHQKQAAHSKGLQAAKATGTAASAQAAEGGNKTDVLEAYLPSAQGLLQLAAQHATGGGADERFAASQLMRVAGACMDWADAPSRAAATDFIMEVITNSNGADDGGGVDLAPASQLQGGVRPWEEEVMALACQVTDTWGPSHLVTVTLPSIMRLADSAGARGVAGAVSEGRQLQALEFLAQLLQHLAPTAPPTVTAEVDDGSILSVAGAVEALTPAANSMESRAGRYALLRCYTLLCMRADGEAYLQPAVSLAAAVAQLMPDDVSQQHALRALLDLAAAWGAPAVDAKLQYARTAGALHRAAEDVADRLAGALHLGGSTTTSEAAQAAGPEAQQQQQPGVRDLDVGGVAALLLRCTEGAVRRRVGEAGIAPARELQAEALLGMARLLHGQATLGKVQAQLGRRMAMQEAHVLQLLCQLLVAFFSPATAEHPRLRQHLARFFEAFAAGGAANQRLLAKAFMPASRKALGVPLLGGTAGRTAALSVMPFVAQLLQQQQHEQQAQPSGGSADDDAAAATAGGDGDDDDPRGHVHLATLLMEELQALLGGGAGELLPASGARVKAYASELCKVPGRLDLASSSEQGLRRLVYLARRAAAELQGDGSQGAAAGAVVYVAARKELLEFVRGLEELQDQGVAPLLDEEADVVLQALREEWRQLPTPDDEAGGGGDDEDEGSMGDAASACTVGSTATGATRRRGAGAPAAAGAARKAAAAKAASTRSRRKATVHEDDDGEEDSGDDGRCQEGDQQQRAGDAGAKPVVRRSSRSAASVASQRLKASAAADGDVQGEDGDSGDDLGAVASGRY